MGLLDVVFPRWCVGCGFLGAYLCGRCRAEMTLHTPSCFYCGKASPLGLVHPTCKRKGGIDGSVSLFRYGGLVRDVVRTVKYGGAWSMVKEILAAYVNPLFQTVLVWKKIGPLVLQPVPLHWSKVNRRGFNQSQIIAEIIAQRTQIRTENLLLKKKDHAPLALEQTKRGRRRAIYNSFQVHIDKVPETVVLVDDVITTGTTMEECARVLKIAGTRRVLGLSVARG